MIKCKNCGADMRYDIEKHELVCDFCGSVVDVTHVHHTDIVSEQQVMEAVVHTCPQCGAELYTTEDTAATFCSYCGSSVLLESRMVMVNKPDFIIPFSITREEAEKVYKKKLAAAIFAPGELKKAEIESIRGIYMPYWEYYLKADNVVKERVTAGTKRVGNYIYSDRNEISFKVNVESDGLEYDASSKFPDDLSQECAPFYFKGSKLFNSAYMSGFYADLGDVNPDLYRNEAETIVSTIAASEIMENSNLDNLGISKEELRRDISYTTSEAGLAMYPVWFACARDKKGKYINYAAINGQTGKTAADLPVDKKKILIGTVLFAIPLFLIFYLLFTPTPLATVAIVALLAIVGTVIGVRKINDMGRNDKGAGKFKKNLTKKEKKERSAEKGKMYGRLGASLFICLLVVVIRPVFDIFYYVAAIAAGVLCGWTYWRIFELHNRSVVRPLPQLDKRGGDGA